MKEYFKNLPDKTTPLSASRINGLLNGEELIEKLVVRDIQCDNLFSQFATKEDVATIQNYVDEQLNDIETLLGGI